MAFILSLCSTCRHKSGLVRPSRSLPSTSPKSENSTGGDGCAAAAVQSLAMAELEEENFAAAAAAAMMTVIELSPDVATHGPIWPAVPVPPSASRRRRRSMSIKGLQDKVRSSWRERRGGDGDSLWTKTIILGEKCRVSDEEEEEVVTMVDKRGHRRTIHTRMTSRPSQRHGLFA